MENDKLLMAAGVTAAVVVGAFVFWGPSGTGSSRVRNRRGQIAGLHNFGRTCFLNTLLQALAACPQFIAWLQLQDNHDKKSLITSLLNTLEVINGTHPTLRGDPHSPGAVIRALSTLGWVIPPDEHDAHELLHVLLSSLEEEIIKPKKLGCLSDVLDDIKIKELLQPRPSSAMLTDFSNSEYDESTSLMRQVRSEAHTPDSPHSGCTDDPNDEIDETLLDQTLGISSELAACERRSRAQRKTYVGNGDGLNLNRLSSSSSRSLERLNRGPHSVSIWSDKMQIQIPHPFKGALSSRLECSACGHKTVVRCDRFDSVTLPLPPIRKIGLSLGQLLSDFVASEILSDVTCEECKETTQHTKSSTFAKLPSCLCIHISRTHWSPNGSLSKRQDFVHFPESLSMAPYSSIQPGLTSKAGTPWGSTMSLLSNSLPNNAESYGLMFPRNLYRLLAVVVHSGEANSGHFVTYRRGALRNSHKWYFTSDTNVKEVSIDEVLSIPAYLLFYDRGAQKVNG